MIPSNFAAFHAKHDMEKEGDGFDATLHSSKELSLAVASRRYPLGRFQTDAVDAFAATGGLSETTYLKSTDPSADLDTSFMELKQQQPQLHSMPSHPVQLVMNTYEMDVVPSNLSVYGSNCKQRVHFLSDNNDYVAVTNLDILQG